MLEDPLGLDRRLGDAARSLGGFRQGLRAGRGEDHAFELAGRIASLELMDELADRASEPLASELLRFALLIHEEHALFDLHVAYAGALRGERHPLDAPERAELTLRELLGHALADTKGQRAAYLEVMLERASRAHERAVRLLEQRADSRERVTAKLTRRLGSTGFGGQPLGDFDLPGGALIEASERWLAATDDAWAALGVTALPRLMEAGLGRESRATWPARASVRAVAELLREARWPEHVVAGGDTELPALGAASFLRGLFRFGAALRTSLADASRPFTLVHDAYGLDRSTFGALIAGLPAGEAFARRELGVSAGGASEHHRTLARVLLVATREAALRVSLRAPSLAGRRVLEQAYPELTHRALGVELPPAALGVLFTPRPGDAQRLAGILLAADLDARVVETHDDDWYRNPRAVEELRELARAPAVPIADAGALARGAARLAAYIARAS